MPQWFLLGYTRYGIAQLFTSIGRALCRSTPWLRALVTRQRRIFRLTHCTNESLVWRKFALLSWGFAITFPHNDRGHHLSVSARSLRLRGPVPAHVAVISFSFSCICT